MGGIFTLFAPQRCLHSIEVRFLLELAYVLLVANSLVAKPIGDLKEVTIYFLYCLYPKLHIFSVGVRVATEMRR